MTRRMIDSSFKDFDLVVVPTTRESPPKINESLAHELTAATGGAMARPTKIYDFFEGSSGCSNTSPFDSFGIPAISLPCGFTSTGMPIGLMIAGPHFSEGKVLALAYAYQQATDWHKRQPQLSADTAVPPIVEGKPPSEAKSKESE